ncbi:hypothetical protein IGI04_002858, partial [Brassica rapa subsp. trilocularis]
MISLLRMIRLLRIQPMDAAAGARVLLRVRKPMRRKKTAQADAAFKRKEKAEAKKKAAEEKKKEAEAKKTEATAKKKVAEAKKKVAELKKQSQARSTYKKVTPPRDGVTRCNVQPDVEDSSLADITDEVVAEQNEFAPKSDVENSELVRSAIIKEFWEKYVRIKMSSSSAVSRNSYRRRSNVERETPKQCWCGEPCYISTSGTFTNPGRLYYCGGKGYNKVRFGSYFACSVDECLVEEVDDIKSLISGMNKDISEFRVNVALLKKEIE